VLVRVRFGLLGILVVAGSLGCSVSTKGAVGDGAVEEGADLVGGDEDGRDPEEDGDKGDWDEEDWSAYCESLTAEIADARDALDALILETEAGIESAQAALEAEADATLAELAADYEAAVAVQEAAIGEAVETGDYEAAFEGMLELWALRDAFDAARSDVMAARAVAAAALRDEAEEAREGVRSAAAAVDAMRVEWLAAGCDSRVML